MKSYEVSFVSSRYVLLHCLGGTIKHIQSSQKTLHNCGIYVDILLCNNEICLYQLSHEET